jgi:hypothetical protein
MLQANLRPIGYRLKRSSKKDADGNDFALLLQGKHPDLNAFSTTG